MRIYITTSRKPSVLTRRLAKWLSALLAAECENRGKRSIAEVLSRADLLGLERVLVIGEDHGNPSKLSFLEESGWGATVLLKNVSLPDGKPRLYAAPRGVALDEGGRRVLELFGIPAAKAGSASASSNELSFDTGSGRLVVKILRVLEE